MIRPMIVACAAVVLLSAEPKPGDVFREYTYAQRFAELDLSSTRAGLDRERANSMAVRTLDIPDLRKAVRAEVSVEYWGGHIGTASQHYRVNGGDWTGIPQPAGTPTPPQCYYRTLSRATVPLAIERLKAGSNTFQFRAGPQVCHGFNWGFYWVYAFTVRVYYDSSRSHPRGAILSPSDDATIGDFPRLVAQAEGAEAAVSSVDFIANYEDFNWEGDGVWRQWHYRLERGRLKNHIGTATAAPYSVTWDTAWIPDQDQPIEISARITDTAGMSYVTPPVKVKFARIDRSVKMYKPTEVPENFGVRVGRRKTCKIPVDGDLAGLRQARLVLSTWSAAHDGEIGLNGKTVSRRFGVIHNFNYDSIPVPARLIQKGVNEFSIQSPTNEHAAEVNWPGPALLIEYGSAPAKLEAKPAWWNKSWRYRLPIEVGAAHVERIDKPAEIDVDFGNPHPAPASLRVIETDSGGHLLDEDVPFQFDSAGAGRGELILLIKGRTPAGRTRRYHVYFNRGRGKTKTAAAASTLRVEENVPCEGQSSIRVSTPGGVYTYHAEGAGFASLRDGDGVEWIGYRPGGGSAGEFRGIPNLSPRFAHPGYSGERGSVSRVLSRGPLRVRIHSESRDAKWACDWDIFLRHARMTLLRNDGPYWFLYEGTPAGRLSVEDAFYALSNGSVMSVATDWAGVLPAPKWAYFGERRSSRVLFVASHQDNPVPDQFYQMENNMTVFGFGRQYKCCDAYLTKTPARFTIGFAQTRQFARAASIIESAVTDLQIRAGAPESLP